MKKLPSNLSAHQWRTLAKHADAIADRLTVITHGWWQGCVFDEYHPGTERFERLSIYALAGLDPKRAAKELTDRMRDFSSAARQAKRLQLWGDDGVGMVGLHEYCACEDYRSETIREMNLEAADELVRLAERCLRNASKPKPSMKFEEIRSEGIRLIQEEHRRFPSLNKFATAIGCSPSCKSFKQVVAELGGNAAILSTKEKPKTVSIGSIDPSALADGDDALERMAKAELLRNLADQLMQPQ